MISQTTIDQVNDIAIYDVISHYVDGLKRTGATWKAKSPFTDEKSASFYVVPRKNIFKDFSSGKGGNAIAFVKEKLGKTFPEAVEEIAGKFGIKVEYEHVAKEEEGAAEAKDLMYKMNEAVARKYHAQLIDTDHTHPAYQEIITNRRYTDETILQWQIGYAPGADEDWKFLVNTIGAANRQTAIDLGLIKESKGVTYDVFRHRVVYPIHDHVGRVVGFGGRTLHPKDKEPAKYINSQESKIYRKEGILFGLCFAQKAIAEMKYAFLMEGYTDVISFHQAGFPNTVGTCGTALTEAQCKLLKRFTTKVVLLRDSDQAGEKASMRDIELLKQFGFNTDIIDWDKAFFEAESNKTTGADERPKIDPDDLTRIF